MSVALDEPQSESEVDYREFAGGLFTIRKLKSGCFQNGHLLLKRAGYRQLSVQFPSESESNGNINEAYINKQINVYTPISKVTHYNIKQHYYNSADFAISRQRLGAGKMDFKRNIRFRVQLATKDSQGTVGGSVTFQDLNINSDADLEQFDELFARPDFQTDSAISQIKDIISFMLTRFNESIKNAMIREIQEECTPTGSTIISRDFIDRHLTYAGLLVKPYIYENYINDETGLPVETSMQYIEDNNRAYFKNASGAKSRAKLQGIYNVTFMFTTTHDIKFRKIREMDAFCTNVVEGEPVKPLYFIYNGKGVKLYYASPPYIIPEPVSVNGGDGVVVDAAAGADHALPAMGGAGAASAAAAGHWWMTRARVRSQLALDRAAGAAAPHGEIVEDNNVEQTEKMLSNFYKNVPPPTYRNSRTENELWFNTHYRGKSTFFPPYKHNEKRNLRKRSTRKQRKNINPSRLSSRHARQTRHREGSTVGV